MKIKKGHIILFVLYIVILTLFLIQQNVDEYIYIELPIDKLLSMILNKDINVIDELDVLKHIDDATPNISLSVNRRGQSVQINPQLPQEVKTNIQTLTDNIKTKLESISLILKIGLYKSCVLLSENIVIDLNNNIDNDMQTSLTAANININITESNKKINNSIKEVLQHLKCYEYEKLDEVSPALSEAKKYASYLSLGLLIITICIGVLCLLTLTRVFLKNILIKYLYRFISVIILIVLIILLLIFLLIPHLPVDNIKQRLDEHDINILNGNILHTDYWGTSLILLVVVCCIYIVLKFLPIKL